MDREKFVTRQAIVADAKLSLTSGEEDARARFLQLAIDTYDYLVSMGADFVMPFDASPESAANALRWGIWGSRIGLRIELSQALVQRWESWNREYFDIRARNPQLELRDLMQDISESHDGSSWPDGYERRIADWIDAGDATAPPPFDDRRDIATPEFFDRLREVTRRCGGWLYSPDKGGLVFAPDSEWRHVRAAQETAEVERRRAWKEAEERSERHAKLLSEAIIKARADPAFWDSLRSWELQREMKRPATITAGPSLTGPLGIAPVPSDSRDQTTARVAWVVQGDPTSGRATVLPYPPLDTIFSEFLARVRAPDDPMTAYMVVLNLRAEIRRELGLDHMLGWPGGPGVGEA